MAPENKIDIFLKNPRLSLWKLTIPMMLGLFVNSIYILVDTYFVGSRLGDDEHMLFSTWICYAFIL